MKCARYLIFVSMNEFPYHILVSKNEIKMYWGEKKKKNEIRELELALDKPSEVKLEADYIC